MRGFSGVVSGISSIRVCDEFCFCVFCLNNYEQRDSVAFERRYDEYRSDVKFAKVFFTMIRVDSRVLLS